MRSAENKECRECEVWKMSTVEDVKCGVWKMCSEKMRSVENEQCRDSVENAECGK